MSLCVRVCMYVRVFVCVCVAVADVFAFPWGGHRPPLCSSMYVY